LNTFKVDLHCHSFFSDGALSPEALLQKALAAQVNLLALTDHDTVAGVGELIAAARHHPIQIIPGIEFSVRWKLHDIHVLGLNIDSNSENLTSTIDKQNEQRTFRAKQIALLLEKLGLEQMYEKARTLAGHERIGRPHFAQLLINEKIVPDMQTAFKHYLGKGKLAYVPTSWLSLEETVNAISQAGGQAVIAHPLKYKLTLTKLRELITAFKSVGGAGLEVISGEMAPAQINTLANLCLHFDLLASSGSDYHDDAYSRIKLGQQRALPEHCKPIWAQWES
jgi:predicted metal-dependent phosphoesterase TrpH